MSLIVAWFAIGVLIGWLAGRQVRSREINELEQIYKKNLANVQLNLDKRIAEYDRLINEQLENLRQR